jgi:hypothetical protein
LVISLPSTQEHFRPDPETQRANSRTVRRSLTEHNRKKENTSTVRSISTAKEQFKGRSSSSSEEAVRVGVQEPSQPRHLVGPGRGVGPVGPKGIQGTTSSRQKLLKKMKLFLAEPSELPVLSKKLFPMTVIFCG